jgi:hypothetical protein
MDRDKVLAQARSQEAGYKDPEINWEATLFSLKSKLNEDPDDPFMKAAIDFLIKDVDGFEEFWTTRSEDINEESD